MWSKSISENLTTYTEWLKQKKYANQNKGVDLTLYTIQQQFGAEGSAKNRLKKESSLFYCLFFFSSDPVQLYYHICGSIPSCPPAGSHQQHIWDPSGCHQNGPFGTSSCPAEDEWHWWAGWTKRAAAFQWNVSDASDLVCAMFIGLFLYIMGTKQDKFGGLEFIEPLNLCS